jgi:hypothetical protein
MADKTSEEMRTVLKAAGITVWHDGDQFTASLDEVYWYATKSFGEGETEEVAIRDAYSRLVAAPENSLAWAPAAEPANSDPIS